MANRYQDALTLLTAADEASLRAMERLAADEDPMVVLPSMVGALASIFAAQVHATLAVADAIAAQPITENGETDVSL